jgi:hypothetical protein
LPAVCAVPADGVAVAVAAVAFWVGAVVWPIAAAGVSPAAAKAIAHPISLICTPDSAWNWRRGCASDFAGSIGAGFQSLKPVFHDVIWVSVEALRRAA